MTDNPEKNTTPGLPSRRRLSSGRRTAYAMAAPLISGFARLFWGSCRIVCVLGQDHAEAVLAAGNPVIPCYWHQRQLFCVRYMLGLRKRGLKLGFLVSPSMDGELAAQVVHGWGAHTIRGSSTRTGAQAMRDLYQAIKRDGISPVTTPDGPRGPAHEFKSGTVMLARLSGAPMLPLSYAASTEWHLRSWDRFVIPRPFTRVAIAVGQPRVVEKDLSASALEPIRQAMQAQLEALGEDAKRALKCSLTN